MTVNDYITLSTDDATTLVKRFKVIQMAMPEDKSQTVERTINGSLTMVMGGIYPSYEFIIRVPQAVSDTSYGTLENLKTFFHYNNPNGVPSDRLILTDHWSASHYVYYTGRYAPEPLCTVIEGTQAGFLVKAAFMEIPT